MLGSLSWQFCRSCCRVWYRAPRVCTAAVLDFVLLVLSCVLAWCLVPCMRRTVPPSGVDRMPSFCFALREVCPSVRACVRCVPRCVASCCGGTVEQYRQHVWCGGARVFVSSRPYDPDRSEDLSQDSSQDSRSHDVVPARPCMCESTKVCAAHGLREAAVRVCPAPSLSASETSPPRNLLATQRRAGTTWRLTDALFRSDLS